MRARVEALLGADCSRHVGLDVSRAVRAAAAPRSAGDRPVARLRHLRLVGSADGRQAGAEGSCTSTTASSSRAPRCRGSATRRTGWRRPRRSRPTPAGTAATSRSRRSTRYYLNALKESNALDFDDLLLRTVELFEQSERVRTKYAEQFRFVMVDEYQDTNRPQYLLIRRLAEMHRNLCVVGDPDQSIYKWRGADLRNILDFEQDFPRSDDRQARAQLPLDADHPRRRLGRHQPEPQPQGQAPLDRPQGRRRGSSISAAATSSRRRTSSRERRAGALADDVEATVAVLYRTNAQSRTIEDALMREGRRLQGRRRRPILRAQGNQGRARLHAPHHQPARRRQPAAGHQRAGARHRQRRHGSGRADCRRHRDACDALPLLAAGLQPALSANSLWARLVRGLERRRLPRPGRRVARRRSAI